MELSVLRHEYIPGSAEAEVFAAPADVVFSPQRGVQPDLFVVPKVGGKRIERYDDIGHLLLAVEIPLAEHLQWQPAGSAAALTIDLVAYFARVLDG